LVDWLVGWLVGRSVSQLLGCSVTYSVGWLSFGRIIWLVVGWSIVWLPVDWLISWLSGGW